MIRFGETVGNYRVVAKLGEGAMGVVFLAEHPIIGRKAALKVIHPEHARNPEVVARFVTEATAINRVGHPHIVEVTDFGTTPGGDFYFAMEYLEGVALSDVIAKEAPLAPARALTIAAQIADALGASHAHGVIHRDLKPDNVFLVPRGDDPAFVKVLDFGLAKLVSHDVARRFDTRTGVVLGTPYYMSPEQCEGSKEIDHRADVYSLGVVLFEMLTGRLPFGGAGYGEVLMQHLVRRPPSIRSVVPELPEHIDAILQRALAKAPGERFATMEQFREALLQPAAAPAPPSPPRAAPADDGLDRVPRSRAPRAVAFLTVAALAGGAFATGLVHAGSVRRSLALAPRLLAATRPAVAQAQVPPAPSTVSLTFGSEPPGATILAPDGTALGETPLAIHVPRSDRAGHYRFEKPGFAPKEMESIPNVSSSMFVRLEPAEPPERDEAEASAARRRAKASARLQRSLDADSVLAPTFDR